MWSLASQPPQPAKNHFFFPSDMAPAKKPTEIMDECKEISEKYSTTPQICFRLKQDLHPPRDFTFPVSGCLVLVVGGPIDVFMWSAKGQ